MNLLDVHLTVPEKDSRWWMRWDGEPVSKKRVGRGRFGHTYNASEKAEDFIKNQVIAAFPRLHVQPPDETHLWGLRCIFYSADLAVSNTPLPGKKRKQPGRRDTDNMLKLIKDAFQGLVWKNDFQVREDYAIMLPSWEPRTEVLFYWLPNGIAISGRPETKKGAPPEGDAPIKPLALVF